MTDQTPDPREAVPTHAVIVMNDGLYLDGKRFPYPIAADSISVQPDLGGMHMVTVSLFVRGSVEVTSR